MRDVNDVPGHFGLHCWTASATAAALQCMPLPTMPPQSTAPARSIKPHVRRKGGVVGRVAGQRLRGVVKWGHGQGAAIHQGCNHSPRGHFVPRNLPGQQLHVSSRSRRGVGWRRSVGRAARAAKWWE